MANAFKNYFLKNANTTSQNVYAAGAGVSATVIGMSIANITNAPISANVTITSGGVEYFMVKQATIASGGSLVPVGGDQKVVLEATDYMRVQTSAANSADVIVSVLEIT
jgi:tryptophanyl-tRNA synthetase